MPANTPNRGYPYPLPGDQTDVPGDIQRLAESVNDDFAALRSDIGARPFCQISSIAVLNLETQPIVGVLNKLTFDTIDHDNAGMVQSSGAEVQIVIPDTDIYWVWAEIHVPQINHADSFDPFIYIELGNTNRGYRIAYTNNSADESTGGLAPSTMHMAGIFQQASQSDRTLQTILDFGSNVRNLDFGVRRMGAMRVRDV